MRVTAVGIAWFRPEDYETLLAMFADRDDVPDTYEDWIQKAERFTNQLKRNGQAYQKVIIDPKTFPAWCAARGFRIDGKARTQFAGEVVSREVSDEQYQVVILNERTDDN